LEEYLLARRVVVGVEVTDFEMGLVVLSNFDSTGFDRAVAIVVEAKGSMWRDQQRVGYFVAWVGTFVAWMDSSFG
jgi:hypothetical protein